MASFIWSPWSGGALGGSRGTGAAVLAALTGSATAKQGFFATGAAVLAALTGSAAAKQGFFATGAATLPALLADSASTLWVSRVSASFAGSPAAWTDRNAVDPTTNWTDRPSTGDPTTNWTDR